MDGFRGGFLVIAAAASVGALTTALAFARRPSSAIDSHLDVETTTAQPVFLTLPHGDHTTPDRGAA
jgi:hypothetical protein